MKSFITLLLILIFSCISHGQEATDHSWNFYTKLSAEANKKYAGSFSTIDIDSLNKVIFDKGKARMKIDTSAKWKILFEYTIHWKHLAWEKTDRIAPIGITPKKKDPGHAYDDAKIYNGTFLYKELGIGRKFLKNDTTKWETFPLIYGRNDRLNRVWVPMVSGPYLILRYVHSYPDGNMTSFYNEMVLYFKKVD